MAVEDDEVIKHYLASKDWRKDGIYGDADKGSRFKILMESIKMGYVNDPGSGGKMDCRPEYLDVVYKLGFEDDVAMFHPFRWRILAKIKIPEPPQKGMYPRQIMLWIPYSESNSVIDELTFPDRDLLPCVASGETETKAKFGNFDDLADYSTDIEGSAPSHDYEKWFSELANGKKWDGSAVTDLKVKDQNFMTDSRVPMGGGGAATVLELSISTEMRCNGANPVHDIKWWALNLSPMCYADGWTGGQEKTFILWSRHDTNVDDDWQKVLYLTGPNHRSSGTATAPNALDPTDVFTQELWGQVKIDGETDIKARPIISILWKLQEAEEWDLEITPAKDLKVETSEFGEVLGKITWSPSEDIEFSSYKLYSALSQDFDSIYPTFVSSDKSKEVVHEYMQPGYLPLQESVPYFTEAWLYLSTLIGRAKSYPYKTNYALAYRPAVLDVWDALARSLGPTLAWYNGFRGSLSGGFIQGSGISHLIMQELWPIGAGVDTWWVGDRVRIAVFHQVEDKDLSSPPGGLVPADIGKKWYVDAPGGGAWTGQSDTVAELTGVSPNTWAFYTLGDDWSLLVVDENRFYRHLSTGGLVIGSYRYLEFTAEEYYVDYLAGQDIVLADEDVPISERLRIQEVYNIGTFPGYNNLLKIIDVGPFFPAYYEYVTKTIICIVRQKIVRIHFKFGDGGRGSTDDVYESLTGYDNVLGNITTLTDTGDLAPGDKLVWMDGFHAWLVELTSVEGNEIEFDLLDSDLQFHTIPPGAQLYRPPTYMYSKSGETHFRFAVEREDGFISDFIANQYPYDIGDINPEWIITSEKLLAEVNEVVRIFANESFLYSQDQVLGTGSALYWWSVDGGVWFSTTVPYIDRVWLSTGTKSVRVYVTNANGEPSVPPGTPAEVEIEIATTVISGVISEVIDMDDFSNGYLDERISGGREVTVDDNFTNDNKQYDSPTKAPRSVTLSGLASSHHTIHPIPNVNTWRNGKGADFIALPDDLVTLLYLENHKAALRMDLEGEVTYLLLEGLDRDRGWEEREKRNWSARFNIVE